MKEHPFVSLIGVNARGRIAFTQIPVLVEEREGRLFLTGHVARKTDHEIAFRENPEVLVVFTSPHTYVSGTWYTGNLQQASTWNYISVHARGRLRWMDEEELVKLLRRLTLHFEHDNTDSTTVYDNLPEAYLAPLRKGIVGFEMEVMELENVHKLSQNRDQESYLNVIAQLGIGGEAGKFIAEKMKENCPHLFNDK